MANQGFSICERKQSSVSKEGSKMTSGTVEQQKIKRLKELEVELSSLNGSITTVEESREIQEMMFQVTKKRIKPEMEEALK
jgi:TolA-binding protein